MKKDYDSEKFRTQIEELYIKIAPDLVYRAMLSLNRQEAEDVVQDVFLKALQMSEESRQRMLENPEAYLFTCLKNQITSFLRSKKCRGSLLQEYKAQTERKKIFPDYQKSSQLIKDSFHEHLNELIPAKNRTPENLEILKEIDHLLDQVICGNGGDETIEVIRKKMNTLIAP